MSYAPKRPAISKKVRAFIFERDGGLCHICGLPLPDKGWHADHVNAREISRDDSIDNLRPAHAECHRAKSKLDVALIAKGNRLRREAGPVEQRRKRKPIPQPKNFRWASRPFPTRGTK